jgi:hypothetical protein
MTLLTKTIASTVKVSTYIITSITVCPVGYARILVIMSVSNVTTAVILFFKSLYLKEVEAEILMNNYRVTNDITKLNLFSFKCENEKVHQYGCHEYKNLI